MGLRQVLLVAAALAWVSMVPSAAAAPHEPVVFALGWDGVSRQFFPHPEACVGTPVVERQVSLGGGYLFDPDGCGALQKARLAYQDKDGSGTWTRGDGTYLQPDGPADQVRDGDLRVGASGKHGPVVQGGESDEGLRTVPIADPPWDFTDRDRSGRWSTGDGLYVDKDRNGFLTPGDLVQMEVLKEAPLGMIGMSYPFLGEPAQVCYIDDNGNGSWQEVEPVFLVQDGLCDVVRPGDLRLVAMRHAVAGTTVREADVEYGMLLSEFTKAEDASTILQDALGLDLEDEDASGSLAQPSGPWRVLDLDASGGPSKGDAFYADMDGDGRTSIGDVRLSSLFGEAVGSIVADGDPDAVAPLPKQSAAETEPRHEGEETRQESKDSPGVASIVVLGILLAFVAAVRRSRWTP